MNLRPAALFLASVGSVNAAYPSSLAWEDCDQNKCATLEFCKNGSNYGKSTIPHKKKYQ
jgi:hypothetical protein